MDILELFLDSPVKAAVAVDSEEELDALVQEFKDSDTAAGSKEALKAILKLLKDK